MNTIYKYCTHSNVGLSFFINNYTAKKTQDKLSEVIFQAENNETNFLNLPDDFKIKE